MSLLKFMNDPDVTPEDAVKVINALAAAGVSGQIAAAAAAMVVGAAGIPIAQADLSTTTGVADTLYEISDGDFRGAKIVWAVPEGASVATWCWWLWPQSAFEI